MASPFDQQVTFLYTGDLAATADFCETTLGLPLALDRGGCRIYHCFLRDPNGYLLEIQRFLDPAWPFEYRRVDTTTREWEQHQQTVCAWLGISIQPKRRAPSCDLAQYVGAYQPPAYFAPAFNHPFYVEHTPDGLRLHMVFMRNFRLVGQDTDCFAILGRPAQLEFVRDAQGKLLGAIYPFVPEQRFFCEKTA